MFLLVWVKGQGFGYMSRVEYEGLPAPVRRRAEVLAVCPSELKAQALVRLVPQRWVDGTLVWRRDG